MSIEVSLPSRPALARSNTLYRDLAESSSSLLNHSSYSPFPSLNGNHDPHGLDQYLLPPEDPQWLYTSPLPAQPERAHGLKKMRSYGSLRRSSPLAQPAISATEIPEPEPLGRRRSSSTSSSPSPPQTKLVIDDFSPAPVPKQSKRQSFRRALTFKRKSSGVGLSAGYREQEEKANVLALEGTEQLPHLSHRPHSTGSSASSTSTLSSEEVQTPTEVASHGEAVATEAKLAAALAAAAAESGSSRRKSFMGWFGGKKAAKSAPAAVAAEVEETPAESSPSSRVLPALTGESGNDDPTDLVQDAISTAERSINRGFLVEQMRRISYTKLAQMNQASPHPWTRTINRQDQNIFDEIAPTLRSAGRSFPLSVNAPDENLTLYPSRQRQWATLCVKNVLNKLDQGMVPEAPLNPRRPARNVAPRLAYPSDFLTRPPFEERNIVFFPNGTFSPISMARPGYGVWDLDFSRYILALCSIDYNPAQKPVRRYSSNAATPAAIPEAPEPADLSTISDSSSLESEPEEVLISPALLLTPLVGEETSVVVASVEETEPEQAIEVAEPISSFRDAKPAPAPWESSDEEDDDEPLATIRNARMSKSFSTYSLPTQIGEPSAGSATSLSRRVLTKRSSMEGDAARRDFAQELARARERRSANDKGEGERRAEIEAHKRKSQSLPRSSSSGVLTRLPHSDSETSLGSIGSAGSSSHKDRHGRAMSAEDLSHMRRPVVPRNHSLPTTPTHKRRSLYDASPSTFTPHAMFNPASQHHAHSQQGHAFWQPVYHAHQQHHQQHPSMPNHMYPTPQSTFRPSMDKRYSAPILAAPISSSHSHSHGQTRTMPLSSHARRHIA